MKACENHHLLGKWNKLKKYYEITATLSEIKLELQEFGREKNVYINSFLPQKDLFQDWQKGVFEA